MFGKVGLSLLLCLLAVGCGEGAEPPGNTDIVATANDQNFPFASAKTFVLPDDVVVLADQSKSTSHVSAFQVATLTPTPTPTPPATPTATPAASLDPETKALILNQIVKNMTERGYVRLTDPSGPKPDIFIQPSVMKTTYTTVYYDSWYPYWGGYYGDWYGGYGYGWAPVTTPYVVSSTLGTLIIEFTDPNHPDAANKKIPSIWVGIVNGAVDSSPQVEVRARIETGIQQAFDQSPYLRRQ